MKCWIAGRWGRRRVRMEECASILTAERVYTSLLADPGTITVGRKGEVQYTVGERMVAVELEVRANAVWRFGRVFLTCPMCSGRATHLPADFDIAGCLPALLGPVLQLAQGGLQGAGAVVLPWLVG